MSRKNINANQPAFRNVIDTDTLSAKKLQKLMDDISGVEIKARRSGPRRVASRTNNWKQFASHAASVPLTNSMALALQDAGIN